MNLLLCAVVLAALAVPLTPVARGAALGLAAAVKLTPAGFVLIFLLERVAQRRA